jgi:hypothetical protein
MLWRNAKQLRASRAVDEGVRVIGMADLRERL